MIIFQGYILIEDFFDVKKELDPVREAINTLVDDLAKKLYDAGKIKSKQILYDNFLSLKNYATITCKYTFNSQVHIFIQNCTRTSGFLSGWQKSRQSFLGPTSYFTRRVNCLRYMYILYFETEPCMLIWFNLCVDRLSNIELFLVNG